MFQEWSLKQYLQERDGHVTVEGVVSGPGLATVYQFLALNKGRSVCRVRAELDVIITGC